jgi:hypothetical protein
MGCCHFFFDIQINGIDGTGVKRSLLLFNRDQQRSHSKEQEQE